MAVETARGAGGRSGGDRSDDHVIVLFGATGDLARRKLLPGLFHLAEAGLMPERFVDRRRLARRARSTSEFLELAREAVEDCGRTACPGRLLGALRRVAARSPQSARGSTRSARRVARPRASSAATPRLLHYLSLPRAPTPG